MINDKRLSVFTKITSLSLLSLILHTNQVSYTMRSFIISLICIFPLLLSAQSTVEQTIQILTPLPLFEADMDEVELFVDWLKPIMTKVETSLQAQPDTGEVFTLITISPDNDPVIEHYARSREGTFVSLASEIKTTSGSFRSNHLTLYLAVLSEVNGGLSETDTALFNWESLPWEQERPAFKQLTLSEQIASIKTWSQKTILPLLASNMVKVDDSFKGVQGFGKAIQAYKAGSGLAYEATSTSDIYWRAVMEMAPGNQLVPTAKAFLHAAEGELDIARLLSSILLSFSEEKSLGRSLLNELEWRIEAVYSSMTADMNTGVAFHDEGNFQKAIAAYQSVQKAYPHCAWIEHEIYLSKATMLMESDDSENATDSLVSLWDKYSASIYAKHPLYWFAAALVAARLVLTVIGCKGVLKIAQRTVGRCMIAQ